MREYAAQHVASSGEGELDTSAAAATGEAHLVDPVIVALLGLDYAALSCPARAGVTLALIHLVLEHDPGLHAHIETLDSASLVPSVARGFQFFSMLIVAIEFLFRFFHST